MLGAGALATVPSWPAETRAPDAPTTLEPKTYKERRALRKLQRKAAGARKRVRPPIRRATPEELEHRNRVAAAESAKILARAELKQRAALPSVPATTWVPLGPTDAARQYNVVDIDGVDSGRPADIVVDPRDANIVYVAVSGGGVWKAFDFLAPTGPTWMPLTDHQPNLAIGALAMDPANPDTLFLGTGDAFDIAGNTIQKSTDGGATWSAPIELRGTYPAPSGYVARIGDIRAIAVQGQTVLAGTNVGLFRSTDGGASFALVDLPNPGRVLVESLWSVLHIGGGQWVASGITGCSETSGPPPKVYGQNAVAACPAGNNSAIWRSNDGVTWTQVATPGAAGTGRVTLAAGGTANPAATAIYAYVGSVDGFATLGFWRSLDGGRTWANATGTLANPTMAYPIGGGQVRQDCGSIDLAHDQTWYDQAIVVDPTNPNNVLVGGNLCGARTRNGMAASPTWELVSHWLPGFATIGTTQNGKLPYVHADWHTGTIVSVNGEVRAFAGTDGGVFSSTNLFTAPAAEQVRWTHHNRGLATHLVYSVASGDPSTGNPFVLFGGLQDNGTRFRTRPAAPTVFNQSVGGDGIGATVHSATSGTTYWASIQYTRVFCKPSAVADCAQGEHWTELAPVLSDPAPDHAEERRKDREYALGLPDSLDSEPFLIHYANVETDATGQSVLTHSVGQVFVAVAGAGGTMTWRPISQDLTPQMRGFNNVTASRTIAGLYGAAGNVSIAPFYFTTAGNTPSTWTVTQPVRPTGTTARLTGPSSMDFPPVLPAGTAPGQVMVGAFTGTMNDGTMVPDDRGRLYRTTDFGQTWTSIVGANPARRLPNVPVHVVKYDPVTPTTIYAGTDVGVYITLDDGATWDRMGEGFPVVPVRDMYVAKNQEFIRVATYGRGFWEIYPSATASQGVTGNGDYDRNLRLDWIDLAAMSSRQGITPVQTKAPFYTWLLDMTGAGSDPPIQSIDGADLEALLGKLGGHP